MRLPSTSTKQIISFKICKLLPYSSIIITSNPHHPLFSKYYDEKAKAIHPSMF